MDALSEGAGRVGSLLSLEAGVVRPIRRSRLVDDVAEQLRQLILSDVLEPGSHLNQTEVADRLGVSRTPLREALRVLEFEGLVRQLSPNNTVEVVVLSVEETIEIYQMREVLEGLAARLCAERGIDEDVEQRLRVALDDMETSSFPFRPEQFVSAHAAFHTTIFAAAGNARLQSCVPLVRLSGQLVRRQLVADHRSGVSRSYGTIDQLLRAGNRDHRTIVDAILQRDPERAERLARSHLRKVLGLDVFKEARAD